MDQLRTITSAIETGTVPEGYDPKKFGKVLKAAAKLRDTTVVHAYPIRRVSHEDNRYTVYAIPYGGTELSPELVEELTVQAKELPVGTIRYASVMNSGSLFECTETGGYIEDDDYRNGVTELSDQYDGVILIADQADRKAIDSLDSHYAIVGLYGKGSKHSIVRIPNSSIGEAPSRQIFEFDTNQLADLNYKGRDSQLGTEGDDEEAPNMMAARMRQFAIIGSIIVTLGVIIWYLFLGK